MAAILVAKERSEFSRSKITKIKEEGNIPAVLYGDKVENVPVIVSVKELVKVIREVGRNGVISLEVSGETYNVILSDYQTDPIRKEIIHADFLSIDLTEEITVDVVVVLNGSAAGEKDGGVAQQILHEVSLTATPGNIPQAIELDISELGIGDTIHVSDIKADANYEINNEDDEVIVTVLLPQEEVEETDEEESVEAEAGDATEEADEE